MPAISLETVVVRSDKVVASSMGSDLVMMNIDRGMYYSLDRIGADIWARLEVPMSVRDLCDQMQQSYAVDAATCAADVIDMLNDMASEGLVVTSP